MMKRQRVLVFAFLFVLGIFLLGMYLVSQSETKQEIDSNQSNPFSSVSRMILPQPEFADDPFAFMTIPFLRSRNYQSTLGELEPASGNSDYSTYITNYSSDELEIQGLLTIPSGDMPQAGWPAIVFVHGYIPPNEYETLERYSEYVHFLARNGFVVFKIDLRGHGESEGEPGGAYYSGDYVIDTLNARAALVRSDFVDPERIGLWGHSMGGNVVFRSLVAQPEIPAAVIWAGAVYTYDDFREYGIQDSSYQPPQSTTSRSQDRQRLFERHGEFDAQNSFWRTVIPTNYVSDLNSSIQVHHAQDDAVVSVRYATNLDSVLDGTSLNHEVWVYQRGGHNITGESFSQAMQRTVEFFREHLPERS